jgi:catechol 2,3-dioxygenase-like lactoylglutathione lyase family enzyme
MRPGRAGSLEEEGPEGTDVPNLATWMQEEAWIMDHTIVHFEIPADDPERATKFYRELFGWDIKKHDAPGGPEYWLISTVPTDSQGRPARPGVNGGLMRRVRPEGQAPRGRGVHAEDGREGHGLVRLSEGPGGERLRDLADGREGRLSGP